MKRGNILLSNIQELEYGTYGVRFKGEHQNRVVGISSLGWEKQTNISYHWDGLTRREKDIIVFQYTLKGTGEIKTNGDIHQLNKGDAFFVRIPSNHQYYLPRYSQEWEFIHLTLYGLEADRSHVSITKDIGEVFSLPLNLSPISIIFKLL